MTRHRRLAADPPVVLVFGATLGELFENAAFAMYEQMYPIRQIAPTYSRPLVAPGDTYEELLEHWLDEVRFVGERDGIVWSSFTVDRLEEGGVQGSSSGLPAAEVATARRRIVGVSGPLSIVPIPDGWWVEIAFVVDQEKGRIRGTETPLPGPSDG